MPSSAAMRILFVCMGNICRSPTAEGIMRRLVADAGLEDVVEVDSAGTGGWHAGEPPDARATAAARRRGVTLEGGARQVRPDDFERFDLIVAMDRENLRELHALAPDDGRAREAPAAGAPTRTCRTRTTAATAGSRPSSTWSGRRCRELLDELRAADRV